MPWDAQIFSAFPEQPSAFSSPSSLFFDIITKKKKIGLQILILPPDILSLTHPCSHLSTLCTTPRKGAGVVSFLILMKIPAKLNIAKGVQLLV